MPISTDGDWITATSVRDDRTWRIRFVDDLLEAAPQTIPDLFSLHDSQYASANTPGPRAVIIDRNVKAIFGDRFAALFARFGIEPIWIEAEGNEESKTLEQYGELAGRLLSLHLDRRGQPLILVGGGTITDIGGFLAATLYRGLPAIRIPTTLLGLCDAGIAAKAAVNHAGVKNSLGTIEPVPLALHCLKLCATESERRTSSGLSEIAKVALTEDPVLWDLLVLHGRELRARRMQHPVGRDVLRRSILPMLTELTDNLREPRLRRTMNFGHFVSPTGEMVPGSTLSHGEWVAVDMALSVVLAVQRGGLAHDLGREILLVLGMRLGLPLWHDSLSDPGTLSAALRATAAHRGGRLQLPMLLGIAKVEFVDDIELSDLERAASELRQQAAALSCPR
jgi:2-epi-5-epi-valiolone synthase